MKDFAISGDTLVDYLGKDSSVIVPDGVKRIGKDAFYNCSALIELYCPDSVTAIDAGAFANCKKLSTVLLSAQTREIGDNAFFNCRKLKEIVNTEQVETIGKAAFFGCAALADIRLNEQVRLGSRAFEGCGGLADSDGLVRVGGVIFGYTLTESFLMIPDSVREISDYAFFNNRQLQCVVIPDTVQRIGGMAFQRCRRLIDAVVPAHVELGYKAFYDCPKLADVNGFVVVNGTLFDYNSDRKRLRIPSGVKHIDSNVFYGDDQIESVELPDGLVSIGDSAFFMCGALRELRVPDSLAEIGRCAFWGCRRLADRNGLVIVKDTVFYSVNGLERVHIPTGVSCIGEEAFTGRYDLKEVTVPEGVVSIGSFAFRRCHQITEMKLPDSVKEVAGNAFEYCDLSLEAPHLPMRSEYAADLKRALIRGFARAAEAGRAIPEANREGYLRYLRSQRKKLYSYAVQEAPLMRLMLREKVLPEADFEEVMSMVSESGNAELSAMLLEYRDRELDPWFAEKTFEKQMNFALTGKMTLTEARKSWNFKELNDGTLMITGYRGTEHDAVIPSVIGKNQVTYVGFGAFTPNLQGLRKDTAARRKAITGVTVPEGVTVIGEYAFYGCVNLQSVSLPESLRQIGKQAFRYAWAMRELRIPDSVIKIEPDAFSDTDITIHASPKSYAAAFAKTNHVSFKAE